MSRRTVAVPGRRRARGHHPGVDMALVTKNALLHRHRSAVLTALSVNVGIAFRCSSRVSCRSSSVGHGDTTGPLLGGLFNTMGSCGS